MYKRQEVDRSACSDTCQGQENTVDNMSRVPARPFQAFIVVILFPIQETGFRERISGLLPVEMIQDPLGPGGIPGNAFGPFTGWFV